MYTQGYTYPRYIYPTHTYPKYAYPRYIYPGYTYPIYIYPEYVYICTFTYLRYIFQKNNIPKVCIPYLCLLSMCKVIYTLGYVQNITYFVRIELGARAPRIYIYIYIHGDYSVIDDRIIFCTYFVLLTTYVCTAYDTRLYCFV
jgi:hypothetical protein